MATACRWLLAVAGWPADRLRWKGSSIFYRCRLLADWLGFGGMRLGM
jgi:hypothetical protein